MLVATHSSEWRTRVTLTLARRPGPAHPAYEIREPTLVGSRPASTRTTVMPVSGTTAEPEALPFDIVEEWGTQSFPASDPPSNW
jgi:hypothetical protein